MHSFYFAGYVAQDVYHRFFELHVPWLGSGENENFFFKILFVMHDYI